MGQEQEQEPAASTEPPPVAGVYIYTQDSPVIRMTIAPGRGVIIRNSSHIESAFDKVTLGEKIKRARRTGQLEAWAYYDEAEERLILGHSNSDVESIYIRGSSYPVQMNHVGDLSRRLVVGIMGRTRADIDGQLKRLHESLPRGRKI